MIFSTKDRVDLIREDVKDGLHGYLATVCRELGSDLCIVGGTGNHAHVLCNLPRTIAIAKLVEEIKRPSSKWMKQQHGVRAFAWQNGYGAFSIGESQLAAARKYVENQAGHHQRKTFQEEFREFLKRYNIAYDERYVWD